MPDFIKGMLLIIGMLAIGVAMIYAQLFSPCNDEELEAIVSDIRVFPELKEDFMNLTKDGSLSVWEYNNIRQKAIYINDRKYKPTVEKLRREYGQ